jgi:hypothetical protein
MPKRKHKARKQRKHECLITRANKRRARHAANLRALEASKVNQ